VAKAEYFTTPGIKGWFQKLFFSGAGQVPIDRTSASAAEGALASATRILDAGELFGIYPEGTRSHDGRLYRGKTGVARLALETRVPVIPVAVVGTDVVAPPGKKFGSFTRPVVRFGKPLDFSATRAWRTTASSCARSPTRSCTRSCGCPSRSTSTFTPPGQAVGPPGGQGGQGGRSQGQGRGEGRGGRHQRRRRGEEGVLSAAAPTRPETVVEGPPLRRPRGAALGALGPHGRADGLAVGQLRRSGPYRRLPDRVVRLDVLRAVGLPQQDQANLGPVGRRP
jgi:1-acyl-sn-glycerol-3-phosphate acyltransferase